MIYDFSPRPSSVLVLCKIEVQCEAEPFDGELAVMNAYGRDDHPFLRVKPLGDLEYVSISFIFHDLLI